MQLNKKKCSKNIHCHKNKTKIIQAGKKGVQFYKCFYQQRKWSKRQQKLSDKLNKSKQKNAKNWQKHDNTNTTRQLKEEKMNKGDKFDKKKGDELK